MSKPARAENNALDRFPACSDGDYTVDEAAGTFIIGRVTAPPEAQRSWHQVAAVETKDQAIRLAKGLAADHGTNVFYANSSAAFALLKSGDTRTSH